MKHLDQLIDQLGGFGRFQLLTVFGMFSSYFVTGWSMMQMTFAGLIPKWHCVVDRSENMSDAGTSDLLEITLNSSYLINMASNVTKLPTYFTNETLNACSVNGTKCQTFFFLGSSNTIINQWDLVCELAWVKQIVTSAQMLGVLIGAVASGQLGDRFGRKNVFYVFMAEHTIINVVTAFSTTWIMFAVCRLFIGIGLGGILVVIFPYSLEFFPQKWRAILSCFPFFALGVAAFSGGAFLLDNWIHLHIVCAAINFPYVFGWFYFPDSPRWLAVHGRLDEAMRGIESVARLNKKPVPSTTMTLLEEVAREEREIRQGGQSYSYLDLFKSFTIAKISLALCFMWVSLNIVYYGISFGVASLDGNLYLNIFLMSIMEIPVQFTTLYTNNKFGRRPSAMFYFFISAAAAGGCLITSLAVSGKSNGAIIGGLCLTAKMLIGAAWCVILLWGVELYPTVIRNLGYGLSNTAARVGGVVAPFIINLDQMKEESYAIMTCLLFVSAVISIIIPETRDIALKDSLVVGIARSNTENVECGEGEVLVENGAYQSDKPKEFKCKETKVLHAKA